MTADESTPSMAGDDGATDPVAERLLRDGFGFTWGETDGTRWLRTDDGDYKRVVPSFFERLRELATGEVDADAVDPAAIRTIEHLYGEGYLEPGGDVVRRETPDDIRLWPRLAAFVATLGLLVGCLALRRAELRRLPADLEFGLGLAALGTPILLATLACHEIGHYVASRRYFEPTIRIGTLNAVVPAVITRTTDAWGCPRNARLWISLAGPFVDAVVATGFAAAFVVAPDRPLLGLLALLIAARMVFVLNPLLEGDGYWLLVDAFGLHNLRSRGFRDLKRATPSGAAAYALAVVLFTVGFVAVNLYVLASVGGLV